MFSRQVRCDCEGGMWFEPRGVVTVDPLHGGGLSTRLAITAA